MRTRGDGVGVSAADSAGSDGLRVRSACTCGAVRYGSTSGQFLGLDVVPFMPRALGRWGGLS